MKTICLIAQSQLKQDVGNVYTINQIENFLERVNQNHLIKQIQKISPLLIKLGDRKCIGVKNPQKRQYHKRNEIQFTQKQEIIKRPELKPIQKFLVVKDPINELKKELKFRLNQLAPENSDLILKHVYKLISETDQLIKIAPQMIIEFGIQSLKYRQQYARLCGELVALLEENNLTDKQNQFQREILIQLKQNFNNLCDTKLEVSDNEEYLLAKNKIISQIRFLGDIYIFNNLNPTILNIVISQLLNRYLTITFKQGDGELYLDILVELLEECGQVFDYRYEVDRDQENIYYSMIKDILKKKTLESISKINEIIFSCELIIDILILITLKLKVSQRIKILIENLEQRSQNQWECTINQNYQKVYQFDDQDENYDSGAETN